MIYFNLNKCQIEYLSPFILICRNKAMNKNHLFLYFDKSGGLIAEFFLAKNWSFNCSNQSFIPIFFS